MTEKKRKLLVKKLEVIFMVVVMLIVTSFPCKVNATIQGIVNVEEVDFSDFSNWRSGVYSFTTGKYTTNNQRLCLNNYVKFQGTKYKVHISNSEYRILIRELDSNKNFLTSCQLSNGQEYKPRANAVYLAISIYRYAGEHGINYTTYETLFDNGFIAELVSTDLSQVVSGGSSSSSEESSESASDLNNVNSSDDVSVVKYEAVEDIDFSVFSNWKTGHYNWINGAYNTWSNRICLKDYVTYEESKYTVNISDTQYHMLIRELDQNMKFIKSFDLADGATYTPSSSAVYLAISIYNYYSESKISYATYKNLFENGFIAELVAYNTSILKPVESLNDSLKGTISGSIDGTISESNSSVNSNMSVSDGSTSASKKDELYKLLERMIKTGDSTVKNVSSYNVTYTVFYNEICPKLRENLKVEFSAYRNLTIGVDITGLFVVKCWLNNVDADAASRVPRVRENVDEFLDTVDSDMKDIEKILLVHEYIVDNTVYQSDAAGICYTAGGPLGNGTGVCTGYAKAMMIMLEELGLETSYASSTSMNHGWVYVKLDGAWYHVDPTWDDTRKGTDSKYMHRFLLRNDKEFSTTLTGNLHYDWTSFTNKSESQKYSDWYVHDVAGTMYYYNGMWYYWDINTNSILASNIEGTNTKVVVDGSACEKIKLGGISGNVLLYYIGSTQYTKIL